MLTRNRRVIFFFFTLVVPAASCCTYVSTVMYAYMKICIQPSSIYNTVVHDENNNNNNISNTVGRKEKGCRLDHMRLAATWWGASPVPGR